ncbi:MAG: SDR family oxidoreductase [Firmicutes bacterium]|nr:SDR family oxidoreductase [Bacillota bacterium]
MPAKAGSWVLPGRWGTPKDLQGVAVLLASNASSYLNGFTIAIDGGWLAR